MGCRGRLMGDAAQPRTPSILGSFRGLILIWSLTFVLLSFFGSSLSSSLYIPATHLAQSLLDACIVLRKPFRVGQPRFFSALVSFNDGLSVISGFSGTEALFDCLRSRYTTGPRQRHISRPRIASPEPAILSAPNPAPNYLLSST